jgi:hypothetical protein
MSPILYVPVVVKGLLKTRALYSRPGCRRYAMVVKLAFTAPEKAMAKFF